MKRTETRTEKKRKEKKRIANSGQEKKEQKIQENNIEQK